jgi:3-deoxy-D-manno-octulosonic-acid transferase
MFNFAEATRLAVEAGAAIQVSAGGSAMRSAVELIADHARRLRMGEAGKKLCEAHRGATEKHLKRGLSLIKS